MDIYSISYLEKTQYIPAVDHKDTQNTAVATCIALHAQTLLNDISAVSSSRAATVESSSPFTPDVPKTYAEIRIKLERLIQYMTNHPDDIQTAKVFFEFLENLEANGVFAAHTELAEMLAKSTGANGLTIYEELVDLLVQYHFYETGDISTDFLEEIRNRFKSGDDRVAKEIIARINAIEKGDAWKSSDGKSITWQQWADESKKSWTSDSIKTWDWIAGGSWGNFLSGNGSNISTLSKDLRMSVIDEIINNPAYKDNAYILVMIIMFMLSDDSACMQISGFGSMGNYYSDRTEEISKIIDGWKDKTPTGFEFFKSIEDFKFKIDKSPYVSSDLKTRIDAKIKEIEDISYDTDKRGDGGATWGSLYQTACGTGQAATDAKSLLDSDFYDVIHNSYPRSEHYTGTDAPFNVIETNLKNISNGVTDQSQVQTTMLTKVTNNEEVIIKLMGSSLNGETGIVGLNNKIIGNQTSR